MALPWVFMLVIGAARAQSSLKFELPGLPYQTELTTLGNDKVEEICNLIGLCLPLKGGSHLENGRAPRGRLCLKCTGQELCL